jgi:hypothetical protein
MPLRQPTQSFDFRVLFGEDCYVLTENMVSIEVDFVTRIIQLTIRDTEDNLSARALNNYLMEPEVLVWDIMKRKQDAPSRTHIFMSLTPITHLMKQDYSSSDIVSHYVVLSYVECEVDYA